MMMMMMIDDNGWTRAAVQRKISNILLSCTDRSTLRRNKVQGSAMLFTDLECCTCSTFKPLISADLLLQLPTTTTSTTSSTRVHRSSAPACSCAHCSASTCLVPSTPPAWSTAALQHLLPCWSSVGPVLVQGQIPESSAPRTATSIL